LEILQALDWRVSPMTPVAWLEVGALSVTPTQPTHTPSSHPTSTSRDLSLVSFILRKVKQSLIFMLLQYPIWCSCTSRRDRPDRLDDEPQVPRPATAHFGSRHTLLVILAKASILDHRLWDSNLTSHISLSLSLSLSADTQPTSTRVGASSWTLSHSTTRQCGSRHRS
jgi:hypothetical protein